MALRTPHRYGSPAPAASLDPRLVGFAVTATVVGAYAALQLFMTRSSVNFLWWRTELMREQDHFRYPKAPVPASALQPTWQEWVPTATTAVVVTTALVLLAILMVRSGRGLWLLLVAVLPLVPVELSPGVWAPPLANTSAYALVFPPGAIQPDTFWAWMEASLQAFTIILPAFVIGRMLTVRLARVWGGEVLWRLAGPAAVAFVVVLWDLGEGLPVDRGAVARTALLVTIGALVITGTRSRRAAAVGLALLPAVAGGLVTWTTDVGGQAAVVVDPTAWRWGGLTLLGAAWALAQPRVRAGVRWGWDAWRAALAAQDGDPAEAEAEGPEADVAEAEGLEADVAEAEGLEAAVPHRARPWPLRTRTGRPAGQSTPLRASQDAGVAEAEVPEAKVPHRARPWPLRTRTGRPAGQSTRLKASQDAGVAEAEVDEVEVAEVEVAEPVSRRRGRGAAVPVGGRHRA